MRYVLLLLFLLTSSLAFGQTKTVLKNLSNNALTESFVVPSGASITINSGASIINQGTATGFASDVPWSVITGKPTTLAGYGITDALTATAAALAYQPLNANLTSIANTSTTFGRSLLTQADASATRSTLGLGTLATQSGTLSDYLTTASAASTYLTTASAASTYQLKDDDLTSIADLTTTTFGRSLLTQADAAATRSTLGLGTLATQSGTISDYLTTASAASTYLTTAAAASTYLTTTSAASTYQQLNTNLTNIAALPSTTTFGRSLLTQADASATRSTLGLGTLATQSGTISDYLTTASAASTYLTTASAASTYLTTASAVSTYQLKDEDLTSISLLSTTTFGRSLLTQADAAAARSTIGLGPLATQAEMQNGLVEDQRLMSPKLVADAIAALGGSGSSIPLPVSIANGGTAATTATTARVSLGVEEVVDAVAREVVVSFSENLEAAWGGASFDLSTTTQVVRIWFDDGMASPPDTPSGGRLIGVGWYGDAIQQGNELAAVLEADAAFTASSPATNGTVNIANSTAGECVAPYEAPTNAYISGYLVTEGVDAYQRMTALDGRALTNVNATTIPAPTASTLGGVRSTASGSGLYLRSLDTSGNFLLGSLPVSDVRYYTSNTTWTNPFPSNSRRVFVRLVGGGGGGGSGRRGAVDTARFGGSGGAGAAVVEFWTLTTELGATASVVIGAGGGGGAAVSTDNTNGNSGTTGGNTTFAGVTASGGSLGGAGGASSSAAGAALPNSCISGVSVAASSAGGAGSSGAGAASNGSLSALPTGGGGGGGLNTSNTNQAGGAGGPMGAAVIAALAGGTAGTSGGGNGGDGIAGRGSGTGGGGGGSTNAGAGGRGGNGGGFGSGGGGGAAGTNGIGSSGAGGNGRSGYALIIVY
jgi:hypothetical protein